MLERCFTVDDFVQVFVLILYHTQYRFQTSIVTLIFYRTLCDTGIAIRFLFNWLQNDYVCGHAYCDASSK